MYEFLLSFESILKFIYMGMIMIDADETKNRINSTGVCCNCQDLLSSGLVSRKVKTFMTIILTIVLLECFKV
jgi:hypothetical protein